MPSTHGNANQENVVVVVIWLKRRVPILSLAIMSGECPPPPLWPVGVGSLRDSAPSDCEGD